MRFALSKTEWFVSHFVSEFFGRKIHLSNNSVFSQETDRNYHR